MCVDAFEFVIQVELVVIQFCAALFMLDVACSIALTLSYITNRRAQRSSQNTRQRAGSSFVGITLLLPCAIMLSTQITIWSPRTTQSRCRCLCLTTQRGHGVLFGRRLSFRPAFVFSVVFSMQLIGGFLNSVCMCRSLWIHTVHQFIVSKLNSFSLMHQAHYQTALLSCAL